MIRKLNQRQRFLALVFSVAGGFAGPVSAQTVNLNYLASMGGAEAGIITVNIEERGGDYAVSGSAESRGLMEMIKGLRVRFAVSGRLVGGLATTVDYEYHHRDNRKERLIRVANGEVSYTKNGEVRPNMPSKKGTDLVSALWMAQSCASLTDVHTGRTQYTFSLVEGSGDRCHYSVVSDDEDDGTFDVDIRYTRRAGLRVPETITSTGFFAGTIRLLTD